MVSVSPWQMYCSGSTLKASAHEVRRLPFSVKRPCSSKVRMSLAPPVNCRFWPSIEVCFCSRLIRGEARHLAEPHPRTPALIFYAPIRRP
jgi:hypothetical protein